MIERFLPDEAATAQLGEDLAQALRPGDVLALSGDLGAGKTSLARGLIRAVAEDPGLEVVSPTFTLVQAYELRLPIHHFDLYRTASPDELRELGLDEALERGAAVIEWPERADTLPPDTLHVTLTHEGDGRRAVVAGQGAAMARVERSLGLRDFLVSAGWGGAVRRHLTGDASARGYETVALPGARPRILMNSPPLALGKPVKDGKTYAEIAHTSRTVAAFVGMDRALAAAGLSVPEIYAQDLGRGFLLIENLGSEGIVDAEGRPIAERYEAAAELLAAFHRKPWTRRVPVAPGLFHDIPPFDRGALAIEVELLLEWYIPRFTGKPADAGLRREFAAVWDGLFDRLERTETGIVQRDYHSPNLIWRADRAGHDRLGVIDFQDALIGPTAYDVASLAMDARVTIPPELERRVAAAYADARKAQGAFDADGFAEAYAITAAQRNSKILGIFVRLDERDGKPHYLKHLPRIRDYLGRACRHPALAALAALYRRHGVLDGDPA